MVVYIKGTDYRRTGIVIHGTPTWSPSDLDIETNRGRQGVGNHINRQQLEDLDDLPDVLDLPVDVWDHKITTEMRGLTDIFAELVDENLILAPSGRIMDNNNTVAKDYSDGVPALMEFQLPLDTTHFSLEVTGGQSVEQKLYVEYDTSVSNKIDDVY